MKREIGIPEEQPPTDDIPLAEWLTRMMILINGSLLSIRDAVSVGSVVVYDLDAFSPVNQFPTRIDSPLKINFGAAKETQFVSMNSNGTITFKNSASSAFTMVANFSVGYSGSTVAFPYIYYSVNGIKSQPLVASLTRSGVIPLEFNISRNFIRGDTIEFFIVRDGGGSNNGGLFTFDTTKSDSPSRHSASINISHKTI